MLISCPRCGKIHKRGECPVPVQRFGSRQTRDSAADKFRNRQVWRRKVAQILDRDMHCCRVCLSAGVINNRELSVHHIIAINADYDKRLDDDNLITLCRLHHEQAERGIVKAARLKELTKQPVNADDLIKTIPPGGRPER